MPSRPACCCSGSAGFGQGDLQPVLVHLSRSSPRVLSQCSCHDCSGSPWHCGVETPFSQRERLRVNSVMARLYLVASGQGQPSWWSQGSPGSWQRFCISVLDSVPCLHMEMNPLSQQTRGAEVLPPFLSKTPLLKAQWVVGQGHPLCPRPWHSPGGWGDAGQGHTPTPRSAIQAFRNLPLQHSSAQQSNHPALATLGPGRAGTLGLATNLGLFSPH